jgi:hypothetical protein
MKKTFSILMIATTVLAVLCFSTSCKKSNILTSCFTLSADTIKAGDTVIIHNCSQDASVYNWDYGNGTTSWTDYSGSTPIVYTLPGTYTITLETTDANGKNLFTSKNIVVLSRGGSWSFNSCESAATTCYVSQNMLIGTGTSTCAPNSTLELIFSSLPTVSGTYTVVTSPPSYGQVAISLGNSSVTYVSGYGLGPNQTLQVTVSGGKVSAVGTSITLEDTNNPTDEFDLTFDLEQQ